MHTLAVASFLDNVKVGHIGFDELALAARCPVRRRFVCFLVFSSHENLLIGVAMSVETPKAAMTH